MSNDELTKTSNVSPIVRNHSETPESPNTVYDVNIRRNPDIKHIVPLLLSALLEIQSESTKVASLVENHTGLVCSETTDPRYSTLLENSNTEEGQQLRESPPAISNEHTNRTEQESDAERLLLSSSHSSRINIPAETLDVPLKHKFLKIPVIKLVFCSTPLIVCLALLFVLFGNAKFSFQAEKITVDCVDGLLVKNFLVQTLHEYNFKVAEHSNSSRLFVTIHVHDPGDWPSGAPIVESRSVKVLHIQGSLHISKLVKLLVHTPVLEELVLDNINGELCLESRERLFKRAADVIGLSLLNLQFINIDGTCTLMLGKFVEQVKLTDLQGISIQGDTFGSPIAALVQDFLRTHGKKLRHIGIRSNKEKMDIASDMVYPQLIRLSFNGNIISKKGFAKSFPRLENLSLGDTPRDLSSIKSIFGCKTLKKLDVAITIPENEKTFSVAFLKNEFPLLQSAHIKLRSTSCEQPAELNGRRNYVLITDHGVLSDVLTHNLVFDSYCKLDYE